MERLGVLPDQDPSSCRDSHSEQLAALEAIANRKRGRSQRPLKPIKEQINQLETLIFCARNAHECEKSAGLIELDLPKPQLDSLGDLNQFVP